MGGVVHNCKFWTTNVFNKKTRTNYREYCNLIKKPVACKGSNRHCLFWEEHTEEKYQLAENY